ncbi:DUF1054 domain-containing protein [Salisediminibacterium selenitireducens]|uniref:UPF0637 protein Bsel_1612 n=1 Tax=Bacillus selenitireducens (strain ATCC 700615 / DSM 15326 / MLS10) TaxID=439292 RepID=D6XTI6_BACIE|nr:DUF1054 domain-containing protein [Salisediminibacterium selenitireducens]ADH99122.1 protein of unknown function DUF1054 [[Bacillus] selenitireducens MLS10]
MAFTGFNETDFETFSIEGLDERMTAIQERIQPKFKALSDSIIPELESITGSDMHLHVARHARRKVNPPQDTWSAYCHNKRGYKKHPHFQIGLFDDHVFIWLAHIYELPHKEDIADRFIENKSSILETLPGDFDISMDHMKKPSQKVSEIDLDDTLKRFKEVKKGEFLVGRKIDSADPLLKDSEAFIKTVIDTFQTVAPLYKIAMRDM